MRNPRTLLDFTHNTFCLRQRINEEIGKKYDLCAMEVDILNFIFIYSQETNASKIVKERNIKKNTISLHINHLVELGYLVREEKQDDRRVANLKLTDKATEIINKSIAENQKLNDKLLNGLTKEEVKEMFYCFDVIKQNAKRLMENKETTC